MVVRHNMLDFANRMRKQAADIEPAAGDVTRKFALVANQAIVMATPVDTGRARANWRISINSDVDGEVGHTSPQATLNENKAAIQGYKGGEIVLQNNVPYIDALNSGSSAQAPANFVEKALLTAARWLQRAKVVR